MGRDSKRRSPAVIELVRQIRCVVFIGADVPALLPAARWPNRRAFQRVFIIGNSSPLDCEALLLMETDGHPAAVADETA